MIPKGLSSPSANKTWDIQTTPYTAPLEVHIYPYACQPAQECGACAPGAIWMFGLPMLVRMGRMPYLKILNLYLVQLNGKHTDPKVWCMITWACLPEHVYLSMFSSRPDVEIQSQQANMNLEFLFLMNGCSLIYSSYASLFIPWRHFCSSCMRKLLQNTWQRLNKPALFTNVRAAAQESSVHTACCWIYILNCLQLCRSIPCWGQLQQHGMSGYGQLLYKQLHWTRSWLAWGLFVEHSGRASVQVCCRIHRWRLRDCK